MSSRAVKSRAKSNAIAAAGSGTAAGAIRLTPSWIIGLTLILLASLLWSYWPAAVELWQNWQHDENYSVGQLVPLAAIYMIWQDRRRLARTRPEPAWLAGGAILLLALALRVVAFWGVIESLERYSMVLSIIGLVVLVAGTRFAYRFKWVLLFLFLMVPFPGRVHTMLSNPLQSYASVSAAFTLELLGVSVERMGNTMVVNHKTSLAVAEACSGLRMLTAFIVTAYVLAYVVNRPGWQKAVLFVASVPIAILCNTLRLVVTAILMDRYNADLARKFFHDGAGYFMMPLAILTMIGLLWLMKRLVVADDGAPAKPHRKLPEVSA